MDGGHPLQESVFSEPNPLAKRLKTVSTETFTSCGEANVPVPAQSRVFTRRSARRGKMTGSTMISDTGPSTSSRKDATSRNHDVSSNSKGIVLEGRRVPMKTVEVAGGRKKTTGTSGHKDEVLADDANDDVDVDIDESSLSMGVITGKQTYAIDTGKEVVEKVKRVLRSSKGKEDAPPSAVNESLDDDLGGFSNAYTLETNKNGVTLELETSKKPSQKTASNNGEQSDMPTR